MDFAERLKQGIAVNLATSNRRQYTDSFGRPSLMMVLTRAKSYQTQECACCYETKKLGDFPRKPPTVACEHDVATCLACLQQWWTACIQNTYWTVIVCPDCPEKLFSDREFRNNNMSNEDIDRCNYVHDRIRTGLNPDYRYCMQPSCNSGQICRDPNIFNCQKCNGYDCVRCNSPTHYHWATHEEYQQSIKDRKAESKLSVAYIESMKVKGNIVACPNCACLIESYGHATRAQCTRCIHDFPWNDSLDVERGELDALTEGAGAERGGVGKGRHVVFAEDGVHHRLIRAETTELGPEAPGKEPYYTLT